VQKETKLEGGERDKYKIEERDKDRKGEKEIEREKVI
jgi:hypothetical protein